MTARHEGMRMKNQQALSQQLRKQSGLTLLEVMVTVVILSLGLLGLAGLQMTGLKNNRNAYYQTVAAQVAQDLAERIKADQAGAKANAYDNFSIDADVSKCGDPKDGVTFSDRAKCLVASLPGGQVRVHEVVNGSNTFYVATRWTDLQLNGANGWAGAKPDPVILACGDVKADTNCYYTVILP